MSTIVTRSGKGSPLSHAEVDSNFTNLNTDKLQSGDTAAALTITSADINGGTIDGVTLGTNSAVTEAQIDNINVNGNAIISTNTDGNIAITPNGTGEVDISKVDIDGGTIDGTAIGGSTPAAATVTQLNSGPLAGFRNAIINGNFDFWQRGTSFSNPADGTYLADMWVVSRDGSGATVTASRQAFTLGQTDVPGEPQYFFRYDQSVAGSGATFNRVAQLVEGVRTFAGQQITIGFWAKGGSAFNIAVDALQNFGTGGSPSSQVVTAALGTTAVTTSWAFYTATVTLPSISGKTLGTNGNDSLSIAVKLPLNAAFTFDMSRVQVERGPAATPFERRPIGIEEALCKRYYRRWDGSSATGYAVGQCFSATSFTVFLDLQPGMRALPTVTTSNVQVWNASATSTHATTDLAVQASSSRNAVRMSGTVASGLVAGDVAILIGSGTGFLALEAVL